LLSVNGDGLTGLLLGDWLALGLLLALSLGVWDRLALVDVLVLSLAEPLAV